MCQFGFFILRFNIEWELVEYILRFNIEWELVEYILHFNIEWGLVEYILLIDEMKIYSGGASSAVHICSVSTYMQCKRIFCLRPKHVRGKLSFNRLVCAIPLTYLKIDSKFIPYVIFIAFQSTGIHIVRISCCECVSV